MSSLKTINSMRHHYLVAAEIVYTTPENPDQLGAIRLNATLLTKNKNVLAADLGRAQQQVQMNFFQKTQDPNVKVMDVVIINLSYLGQMSKEDFAKAPEGMKLQEITEKSSND